MTIVKLGSTRRSLSSCPSRLVYFFPLTHTIILLPFVYAIIFQKYWCASLCFPTFQMAKPRAASVRIIAHKTSVSVVEWFHCFYWLNFKIFLHWTGVWLQFSTLRKQMGPWGIDWLGTAKWPNLTTTAVLQQFLSRWQGSLPGRGAACSSVQSPDLQLTMSC